MVKVCWVASIPLPVASLAIAVSSGILAAGGRFAFSRWEAVGLRVAIGQFGGPTAVINASLEGAIATLEEAGVETWGVFDGPHGLAKDHLQPLDRLEIGAWTWLSRTPGAALRAGRVVSFDATAALAHLKRRAIDALIVMGGNGTMAMAQALQDAAQSDGCGLRVIGVPKTIDNDIAGVDHAPGFPSAANFVVKAVRDLTMDLEAMTGFEQVRVIEVMGRRTGWLAAAAAFARALWLEREKQSMAPHLIYLPERPIALASILGEVERTVQSLGFAVVVTAEELHDPSAQGAAAAVPAAMQVRQGGVGAMIAQAVRDHLGCGARYENLGALQRCWAESATALDREEAYAQGAAAAARCVAGDGGFMVGLRRDHPEEGLYSTSPVTLPFTQVAGKERLLPDHFCRLDQEFLTWIKPLIENIAPLSRLPRRAGVPTR